jgi:hypothetical protein
MFKEDMTPRQENIPLTIDAQYVPGFTWLRNPQFRFVQRFGNMTAAGFALESPQAVVFSGPNAPLVPTTFYNPGGSGLNSTATYSTDIGPDLVAKVSVDPGWGHFELYGLGRAFRSSANFSNRTIFGGGGSAGAIFPVVSKLLDPQADFLIGDGIGRYGSGGLRDVAVKPTGVLVSIPELQALVGLVGHRAEDLDLYAMPAWSRPARPRLRSMARLPSATAIHSITTAVACTRGRRRGEYLARLAGHGRLLVGRLQRRFRQITGRRARLIHRAPVFAGIGGGPNTNEGIFMAAHRYYPFPP